jgi:hypothetical protein
MRLVSSHLSRDVARRRPSWRARFAVGVLAAMAVGGGLPLLPWTFTGEADAAAGVPAPGTADLAAKVGDRAGSAIDARAGSGNLGPQTQGTNPPEGPQGTATMPPSPQEPVTVQTGPAGLRTMTPAPDGELVDLRTEKSRTVRLPDGNLQTTSSVLPMHYRKNGKWEKVDTTLV